jgi:hypothetical protein
MVFQKFGKTNRSKFVMNRNSLRASEVVLSRLVEQKNVAKATG